MASRNKERILVSLFNLGLIHFIIVISLSYYDLNRLWGTSKSRNLVYSKLVLRINIGIKKQQSYFGIKVQLKFYAF